MPDNSRNRKSSKRTPTKKTNSRNRKTTSKNNVDDEDRIPKALKKNNTQNVRTNTNAKKKKIHQKMGLMKMT